MKYALFTAAKNEEAFIKKTLESVVSQTKLPVKWIIVSDGSTDHTNEIVENYSDKYNFIELISISKQEQRNFGSKAKALETAYSKLKIFDFEFIGNLDADVSFNQHYFEKILLKFKENPQLGIAGGVRYDWHGDQFRIVKSARNSVGGPFQFFRKKCYDEIGGYLALQYGGIDAVAEIMARYKGWEVESFPEMHVYHYRRTGSATGSFIKTRFRYGIKNYMIGYHPVYELIRAIRQSPTKPIIVGSISQLVGFFYAMHKRLKRPVSNEFVKFLRTENLQTLKKLI
ncbi:MAG: glycosyltransferase family 2 protein [Calditrichae bacterium]|nr:glycosyltransferase family 2 protein [Calditrichia bacterium]